MVVEVLVTLAEVQAVGVVEAVVDELETLDLRQVAAHVAGQGPVDQVGLLDLHDRE